MSQGCDGKKRSEVEQSAAGGVIGPGEISLFSPQPTGQDFGNVECRETKGREGKRERPGRGAGPLELELELVLVLDLLLVLVHF